MSKARKRILRLGEIIRKMNAGPPDGDAEARTAPAARSLKLSKAALRPVVATGGTRPPERPTATGEDLVDAQGASEHGPPETIPPPPREYPNQEDSSSLESFDANRNSFLDNDEAEDGFDLFKYVGILIRRKEIVILATIASTVFAIFSYLQGDKYYSARARLLHSPDEGALIPQLGYRYYRDREKRFNTHLELLGSATVLDRVARGLGNVVSPGTIKGSLGIQQGVTNGEKNDMIVIAFKHGSAQIARDVVNELCRVYVDYNREVGAQEDTRMIMRLKTQIDKLRAELVSKQDALRQFKESHGMVQVSDETSSVVAKLNSMETALQQTQLDLLSQKEEISALRAQISQQEVNVVESMTYENPYQQRIASLELELSTISAEYSPDHFKVRMIEDQIEKLKEAMVNSIANEASMRTLSKNPVREALVGKLVDVTIRVSSLEARRTAQEQILERFREDLRRVPALEQEYANLQRGDVSMRQTLAMLEKKYEESKIARDSKESDLKILEVARTPTRAISTKKVSGIFTGILVGFLLGVALVLLLEYLDQTLKDASQVEKLLELPLLGAVPHIEAEKALVEKDEKLTKSVLEPFRALRANLKHLTTLHRAQVLMICSAVKGEGKTTLSTNLALTFAMDGKKVILIDADLRRSQIHHYLDVPKEDGLADYLLGKKGLEDIIKPTRHENLFVITSGDRPPNPAELLGTYRFDEMIKEIRSHGDIIIYDSPASLPVSDSIIMAPKMDACVMVVRTLWTPLKAARQAKSQLMRIGTKMLGCILNGVPHSRGYYPYYYGYYGYYSYRYSYEEEPKQKFSLREFGLRTESATREGFENLRLSLPHYLAQVGGFTKYVGSKPLFWVLLILLIAVAGLRLHLRPPTDGREDSQEAFYSMAETAEVQADKAGMANSAPATPRGLPAPNDNGKSSGHSNPVRPSETHPQPSSGSNPSNKAWVVAGLNDSLEALFQALAVRDESRYLSFYDPLEFHYPDGGFAEWRTRIAAPLLRDSTTRGIIILDSSRVEPTKKETYLRTTAYLREARTTDTSSATRSMIWHKNRQEGWRIIRDKTRTN